MKCNLGELLKNLRLALGLSLEKFGESIGYSATYISKLERGKEKVSKQLVSKISEVYRVDSDYFCGEVSLEMAMQEVKSSVDTDIVIGKRIRNMRIEKQMEQKELAKRSGVVASNLSLIERGMSGLKEKTAKKLAEVLEVGVDWIYTGDEEKKNYPADDKMIDWLWQHPEVRAEIWKMMKK